MVESLKCKEKLESTDTHKLSSQQKIVQMVQRKSGMILSVQSQKIQGFCVAKFCDAI